MNQPDHRAPSISLDPREPEMRARWARQEPPGQRPAPLELEVASDVTLVLGLLVAFLLGVIGLGIYAWIDPVVRAALAVWERVQ